MNALDLLYAPLAIATAPWWARKQRGGWSERFGRISDVPDRGGADGHSGDRRRRLLLHAVSVGEVNALRALVPLLERDVQIIVSATTDTGLARARALFAGVCDIARYPLDFSTSVARFLDATRPDAVALVELELWPNFVRACERRGIPVAVINGRLSERSFRGYRRFRRALSGTFARLAFAGVQDSAYAERFIAMGVTPDRCVITGSMKWDAAKIEDRVEGADALANSLGIDRTRPLIVAGSTMEDEEAMLHGACPGGVQLLCAPRKPEHFDEAARAMPGCRRRSAATTSNHPSTDRFLLDTIGELRAAYALADVVVMGRSFGTLYGSDPIEPSALGKPVIAGPRMSDFASVTSSLEAAGGLVRSDRSTIAKDLASLLSDAARRSDITQRARACIVANQGATERHRVRLLELVGAIASLQPAKAERAGADAGTIASNRLECGSAALQRPADHRSASLASPVGPNRAVCEDESSGL